MARTQALFAVQVLYPLALTGSLQLDLIRTVRRGPERMSAEAKNAYYDGLADLLLRHSAHLQYAAWEFIDDPDEAKEVYWNWLEGTAIDAEDEANEPYRDEAYYGFVTVLILAEAGGSAAEMLASLTDVDDEDGVRSDLLEHLVRLLGALDYGSITSDVVMVRPGAGGRGVAETLLGDDTYQHLGPVI